MEDQSRIFERRKSIRLKIICLAMYTRFDKMGRPADQKPCRTINLGLGGVKLQTGFPVNPGEVLDVSMVLGENSITFKGAVIYVNPSRDEDFELGVSIREIEAADRIALSQFIYYFNPYSESDKEREIED